MKTLTLQEIHAEAKKYDPNCEPLQDAFVAGARFALTGKYYKPAEMFDTQPDTKRVAVIVNNKSTILDVPTFDQWWNLYAYKQGKKKASEKWQRLSLQDRAACMKATPAYVANTVISSQATRGDRRQYRMHPLTYLNGEHWNDEIYLATNNEQQQRAEQLAAKAARILGFGNPG